MSAYLLVVRDRAGKAVEMDIYSGEALTLDLRWRSERAPRDYAAIESAAFSDAKAQIIARMLADTDPWPGELQPYVDRILAPFRQGNPYREPAPAPSDTRTPARATMTTEEFAGHLMSALHGPHATTIVARIVEIITTQPVVSDEQGQAIAEKASAAFGLDRLENMVLALAVVALSEAKSPTRDPAEVMRRASDHVAAVTLLRETARLFVGDDLDAASGPAREMLQRLGLL